MKYKMIYRLALIILLILALFMAFQLHKHYTQLTTITEWNNTSDRNEKPIDDGITNSYS